MYQAVVIITSTLVLAVSAVEGNSRNIAYLRSISTFSKANHCKEAPVGIVKLCSNSTTAEVCFDQEPVFAELCLGSKSVCVEGECGSRHKSEFKCPEEYGYYPSLSSCNEYYICNNFKAYLINCLNKSVYDPISMTCVKQTSQKPCNRFNCAGKHLKYAAYPGNKRLYALCAKGQPIAMGQCAGNGQGMNEDGEMCDVYCTREGNIADPKNCRGYLECVLQGSIRFRINRRQCPPQMHFNTTSLLCAPGDLCS